MSKRTYERKRTRNPEGGPGHFEDRHRHWSHAHAKASNQAARAKKKAKGQAIGHRQRALRKLRSAARRAGVVIKSIRVGGDES